MPHFQIELLEGKSEEQKQELTDEVVKVAQKILGNGNESFSVAIEEYSLDEWKNKVYPDDIMGNEDKLYKKPGYTM